MSKHSPGPWSTDYGMIYSAEGHTVASCTDEDGEYPDPEHGPHDAALIAAAPVLANTVRGFRQKLATYVSVYPGDKELRELLSMCDAALAQVDGAEPKTAGGLP